MYLIKNKFFSVKVIDKKSQVYVNVKFSKKREINGV